MGDLVSSPPSMERHYSSGSQPVNSAAYPQYGAYYGNMEYHLNQHGQAINSQVGTGRISPDRQITQVFRVSQVSSFTSEPLAAEMAATARKILHDSSHCGLFHGEKSVSFT